MNADAASCRQATFTGDEPWDAMELRVADDCSRDQENFVRVGERTESPFAGRRTRTGRDASKLLIELKSFRRTEGRAG